MPTEYISFAIILFLLSMICERFADFLKHSFGEDSNFLIRWLKRILKIGNTSKKNKLSTDEESKRYFRILKINLFCGFVTSLMLHADLFSIATNINATNGGGVYFGWKNFDWAQFFKNSPWYILEHSILYAIGCLGTGLFISFGSKFWHDLLDLLLEVKNAKRIANDSETYKIDNIASFDRIVKTYQSDFIKAAYSEARTKYMSIPRVKAMALKADDLGYYFELTLLPPLTGIDSEYVYSLTGGGEQTIRIKLIELPPSDPIIAHSFDLSSRIFDKGTPINWGTAGCLVKEKDSTNTKVYLLTCCHTVIFPVRDWNKKEKDFSKLEPMTEDLPQKLGTVYKAFRDHEADVALIEIDPTIVTNKIRGIGKPGKARVLKSSDENKVEAFTYGATSHDQKGTVTSIYSSVEIEYEKGIDNFRIDNLLAISNNGKAISAEGDSGCCLVDKDMNVVGLIVAGSKTTSYAMNIETLLVKLNLELV